MPPAPVKQADLPPSAMVCRAENNMDKVYKRVTTCPKTQLKLSIGDPTFDGNLSTSAEATAALVELAHTPKLLGYQRTWGSPIACDAVAAYWAERFAENCKDTCKGENVVLTCGGSEALLLTMLAIANTGDNILIPAPGFPQYAFTCDLYGIEGRHYHLRADKEWEVDLDEIRRLVDDNTRAIVITNPSNPCGSNFSRAHVAEILAVAEELKLPVIADEIYAGMVFAGEAFTSVSSVQSTVPRFVVGGTAKTFMAPGWRFGWVMLVDPQGYCASILNGIHNLCMLALGPNALTQHALPKILSQTKAEYYQKNILEIERNAKLFADALESCCGLSCLPPKGAMYIMVKIHFEEFKDFKDDEAFYMALEDEENVQVVPGSYMFQPGYFRVCITRPSSVIEQVIPRLVDFCERHKK